MTLEGENVYAERLNSRSALDVSARTLYIVVTSLSLCDFRIMLSLVSVDVFIIGISIVEGGGKWIGESGSKIDGFTHIPMN